MRKAAIVAARAQLVTGTQDPDLTWHEVSLRNCNNAYNAERQHRTLLTVTRKHRNVLFGAMQGGRAKQSPISILPYTIEP